MLAGIGAPVTAENLATIAMWQHMEGQTDQGQGMTGAAALNNPLATTWGRSQGYDPYNYIRDEAGELILDKSGNRQGLVWNYPDYATGVQNTVNTFDHAGGVTYDPLVQGLQNSTSAAMLNLLPGVQDALGTWSGQGYNEFANAPLPDWATGMNPNDFGSVDALSQALAANPEWSGIFG